MSRFYKNQFKTRFLSGMMKLSLLMIALLVGFSTTYAQEGRTLTVSDNNSLMEALDNKNVGVILLTEGYYEHLKLNVAKGEKVYYITPEGEGGIIILGTCTYTIPPPVGGTLCNATDGNQIELLQLSPDPCPPITGNGWTVAPGAPGTVYWSDPLLDFVQTNVTVSVAGTYVFQYQIYPGTFISRTLKWEESPDIPTASDITECEQFPMQTLTAVTDPVPAGVTVNWFDAEVNGNPAPSPTLNALGSVTYWAEAENTTTGCKSPGMVSVTLTINPAPAAPEIAVTGPDCGVDGFASIIGYDSGLTYTFYDDANVQITPVTITERVDGLITYGDIDGIGFVSVTVTVTSADGCVSDNSEQFKVEEEHPIPNLDNPGPQTACDSFTLPTITGTNLSGNEAYYDDSQANGGQMITSGVITSTMTVWIYDESGTTPNCTDEVSFEVTIYETPSGLVATADDVCFDREIGLATTTLTGSHNPATAPNPSDFAYQWTKTAGPGNATFGTATETTTTVTVDECGTYTFTYEVTNGDCDEPVSTTVAVKFYDKPSALNVNVPAQVCGYTTPFSASFQMDCKQLGDAEVSFETKEKPAGATNDPVIVGTSTGTITVDYCGTYTFTMIVKNEECETEYDFSIHFFEPPVLSISGTRTPTLCMEVEYSVVDETCGDPDITYTWTISGGSFVDGVNEGTTVKVKWDTPGEHTLYVDGTIDEFVGQVSCEGTASITINTEFPVIAGQVKYWNQFETYMPSPFPTKDFATYPHDYFYVSLVVQPTKNGSPIVLETVNVEAFLDIDELGNPIELMSYFGFDIEDYWSSYLCGPYYLQIWDGGLYYHYAFPGGSGVPPVSGTHLGANYTYNNWGGVNATDALAILNMAADLPLPTTWGVGVPGDTPRYGYFSNLAADVNSSRLTLLTDGISALDALITNYRAVGFMDVFPNSQTGVQYSPNFRVTGRMVDELPKMTWNPVGAFDYNPLGDDVPFEHSGESYLYFDDATDHKYTSYEIPLTSKNYINIYYLALGDINSSHVPTTTGFKSESAIELAYIDEIAVRKGDIATVPVRVNRGVDIAALTLNMSYNTSLIEIVDVNFENDSYRIDEESGTLRIGWYSQSPVYYQAGETIALITVRVLDDVTSDMRLFELEAGTELADINALVIEGVMLDTDGLSTTTSVGHLDANDLFVTNYPNPFRDATTISYYLPSASQVQLVVYNKMGQVIETLVDDNQAAGAHKVDFDRSDLLPGVYYYKIVVSGDAGIFTQTNSMIMIR